MRLEQQFGAAELYRWDIAGAPHLKVRTLAESQLLAGALGAFLPKQTFSGAQGGEPRQGFSFPAA